LQKEDMFGGVISFRWGLHWNRGGAFIESGALSFRWGIHWNRS